MSDSEERKLPATDRKLRKAREEGNIPRAQDLALLAPIPAICWLLFDWTSFQSRLQALVARFFTDPASIDALSLPAAVSAGLTEAALLSLPLLVTTMFVGIAINVLDIGGFIFTTKPLRPDLNRLNIVEGAKNLFSTKNAVAGALSLMKLAAFAGGLAAAAPAIIAALRRAQLCRMPCVPEIMHDMLVVIVVTATLVLIVAAIADVMISRALYKGEMKMSFSEMKQDNKESYGNREIKQAQRRLGRELTSNPAQMGLAHATLLIASANRAVALRFDRIKQPVPIVTAMAADVAAEAMVIEAQRLNLPTSRNADLAEHLFSKALRGGPVPPETYHAIAVEILKLQG
jgi:type III secretion protein U